MIRLFKCFGLFVSFWVCSLSSLGQNSFGKEMVFVNHLLSRNHLDEAFFALDNIECYSISQCDSLNYLKGWIMYTQKDLNLSINFLEKVSKSSPFYTKSGFFAAYNYAYLGQTQSSLNILENISSDDAEIVNAMINFQRSGIALLERRFSDFQEYADVYDFDMGILSMEKEKMMTYHDRLNKYRSKSPLLAGFMSAAVPGLGKVYAGKTYEGISNFLYVGVLSAIAYDFQRKQGFSSPLFISSAVLGSVFYLGNIWGSVVAVNRVNKEFYHEMDQRILLDLHLPLRRLFP